MEKKGKLLKLLEENALWTDRELSVMLGISEEEVLKIRKELEDESIITGYRTVVNWEKFSKDHIEALIELKVTPRKDTGFDEIAKNIVDFKEVESLYLMSGGFDFAVIVRGKTFQEIAMFVAKRLSPLTSVISTKTHFILSKYKEKGFQINECQDDERGGALC
jgi:Transcriptional regulators